LTAKWRRRRDIENEDSFQSGVSPNFQNFHPFHLT
jgi:hypothetical protein